MSHFKEKHKEYLIKNGITNEEDLVIYLDILRNSRNSAQEDRQMLMDFAWFMIHDRPSVLSFFAENKNPSKEFFNAFKKFAENEDKNSPTFMDEVLSDLQEKEIFDKKVEKYRIGECDNKIAMVNILDMSIEADSTKNKTETSTEIPNFKYVNALYRDPKKFAILDLNGQKGKKESQTVKKAPIFTFCKQMKNAIEEMAFRTEYGHNKYIEFDADYNNFARVGNGDEEYGNAQFRHALGIGDDSELEHYVASAWDAVARLEIYLRNKVK